MLRSDIFCRPNAGCRFRTTGSPMPIQVLPLGQISRQFGNFVAQFCFPLFGLYEAGIFLTALFGKKKKEEEKETKDS